MGSHCAPDCYRCDNCQGVFPLARGDEDDGSGSCVDCFATLCPSCYHPPENREHLIAKGVDSYDAGERANPLCHTCWINRTPETRSVSKCGICELNNEEGISE